MSLGFLLLFYVLIVLVQTHIVHIHILNKMQTVARCLFLFCVGDIFTDGFPSPHHEAHLFFGIAQNAVLHSYQFFKLFS